MQMELVIRSCQPNRPLCSTLLLAPTPRHQVATMSRLGCAASRLAVRAR